jgi:hypothetical protein
MPNAEESQENRLKSFANVFKSYLLLQRARHNRRYS